MAIFLAYGAVNITVTYKSGNAVYAPMTWDSVTSWIIGLSLLPFAFGVYVGLFYLTRWKFRRLGMETNNQVY
jgi:hypothetical protein